MTLVKICGITNLEDAQMAVDTDADLLGFHFCPSRRATTPDEAARVIEQLEPRPTVVGVFIDASEDEADSIADYCGLDMVQLHGSEEPGFRSARRVMKVLKVREGEIPDVEEWPDPIMLDSWSPNQQGGTGIPWAWHRATAIIRERSVFLAGGLVPETVGEVVRQLRPYGVDVSSGVEDKVRHKDPEKVARFVREVREADGAAGG